MPFAPLGLEEQRYVNTKSLLGSHPMTGPLLSTSPEDFPHHSRIRDKDQWRGVLLGVGEEADNPSSKSAVMRAVLAGLKRPVAGPSRAGWTKEPISSVRPHRTLSSTDQRNHVTGKPGLVNGDLQLPTLHYAAPQPRRCQAAEAGGEPWRGRAWLTPLSWPLKYFKWCRGSRVGLGAGWPPSSSGLPSVSVSTSPGSALTATPGLSRSDEMNSGLPRKPGPFSHIGMLAVRTTPHLATTTFHNTRDTAAETHRPSVEIGDQLRDLPAARTGTGRAESLAARRCTIHPPLSEH